MNISNQNRLAMVMVTALASMVISQARAQYRAVSDDGIAASPKVRQMLNERKTVAPTAGRLNRGRALLNH